MPPLIESNPSGTRRRQSPDTGMGSRSSSGDELPKVKCVLVGDGAVGKTSLLVSYSKSEYPSPDYVPTAFDNYSVVVKVDGRPIRLQLCDTAGQDELDSLRALCYSDSDVFLVCFSVMCHTSFYNVTAKWLPEIRRHCSKDVPVILVGTQCDLRNDDAALAELAKYNERPVSEPASRKLAADAGCAMYTECSSFTNHNVKDVFDWAIFAALDRQGFVRKCRGLGSIRGSKKYRCKSKLWDGNNGNMDDATTEKKQRKRWKLFSCLSSSSTS